MRAVINSSWDFDHNTALTLLPAGASALGAGFSDNSALTVALTAGGGVSKTTEDGLLNPVHLPRTSEGLYLMQRVRDEAHRFAVTYHRKVRGKQTIISQLDGVPGIGPKRRSALLKHFGSIDAIRAAGVEELAAVPGMNRKAAEQLKGSL